MAETTYCAQCGMTFRVGRPHRFKDVLSRRAEPKCGRLYGEGSHDKRRKTMTETVRDKTIVVWVPA